MNGDAQSMEPRVSYDAADMLTPEAPAMKVLAFVKTNRYAWPDVTRLPVPAANVV